MLDGTYLSRNFATLGPLTWQPPCDSRSMSLMRLSYLSGPKCSVLDRVYPSIGSIGSSFSFLFFWSSLGRVLSSSAARAWKKTEIKIENCNPRTMYLEWNEKKEEIVDHELHFHSICQEGLLLLSQSYANIILILEKKSTKGWDHRIGPTDWNFF